jgi:hypothetical protein
MTARTRFSADEAQRMGVEIGIDWDSAPSDVSNSGVPGASRTCPSSYLSVFR